MAARRKRAVGDERKDVDAKAGNRLQPRTSHPARGHTRRLARVRACGGDYWLVTAMRSTSPVA